LYGSTKLDMAGLYDGDDSFAESDRDDVVFAGRGSDDVEAGEGNVRLPLVPVLPKVLCEEKATNFLALFQPEQRSCAPPRMISLRDKHQAETQRSIE